MKKQAIRWISIFLTAAFLLSMSAPAFAAATKTTLASAVSASASYLLRTVKAPQVGSIGGEWTIIGLARSGCEIPQSYWDTYYDAVKTYTAANNGVLDQRKYTEYSRVILALTAIGADPTDVSGYNLLTPLGDFDKTVWQGINGPIWALIALDSGDYTMPTNSSTQTQATRQMYVNEILSRQNSDGGWSLSANTATSDPDITGMALQALAKYQNQLKVKAATNKAINCLSKMQDTSGGYSSWGTANAESVVQVIVALCELGISLDDARFVKNGNTLLDNLMGYKQANGSFSHAASENGNDLMATEQAFYGLVAALRAAEGKSSLYRMTDRTVQISENTASQIGLPGKNAAVQQVAVTNPGITFADIKSHKNRSAIEALAERGIITGYNTVSFGPDDTMTRAQFAAIVVRALGLKLQTSNSFADVNANAWYAPYVGTAYAYGIVNGKTNTTFDPEGTITREEAAAMVARAAKLCGMDTALENYEILNALASFSDYITVSAWARESVAFCYNSNILDQNDLNIVPNRAILRCEIAQMLNNMLRSAKLM